MFEYLRPPGVISAALIAPPGPDVIGALARIDPRLVSDAAQVDLLVAWERQAAWVAACQQPVLAAVGDAAEAAARKASESRDSGDVPARAAHAEIGAALRLPSVTASGRLMTARALSQRLPIVAQALAAGEFSFWHANAICDATEQLDDDKAAWVAQRVLPRAGKQTVSELRRALRRAVLAVDPRSARERAAAARKDRGLDWWTLPDGMAELRLIASATDVMSVFGAADALAKAAGKGQAAAADAWFPVAARRADALVALVTGAGDGGHAGGRSAVAIQLTMDLATLLGLQDNPAELAGYGPLPAPLARALAADGKWRRLIHEPLAGALLDLGHSSYTPNADLVRYIRARDARCQFPGCSRPAHRCDLDHTRPYKPDDPEGGRTDRGNLGPLCAQHHRLKHRFGWTLCRDPETELATWTSPTGHSYRVDHHDHRPEPTMPPADHLIEPEWPVVVADPDLLWDPVEPQDLEPQDLEPHDPWGLAAA
jgi:hypothetical protein